MIPEPTPFDHRPDPVLGNALQRALDPDDQAAFVARVMTALENARTAHWDVLASWARAGIAAAVLAVILLGGFLAGRPTRSVASLDDVLALAAPPSAGVLVGASSPPEPSVVLPSAEER